MAVASVKQSNGPHGKPHRYGMTAILGYVGVTIGSYAVIGHVLLLSSYLHTVEFLISFFLVAVGTSLPQLVVELAPIRKKQHETATMDAKESSIVDGSLSIWVCPLIFPATVSGELAETTDVYVLLTSSVVSQREQREPGRAILFDSQQV